MFVALPIQIVSSLLDRHHSSTGSPGVSSQRELQIRITGTGIAS